MENVYNIEKYDSHGWIAVYEVRGSAADATDAVTRHAQQTGIEHRATLRAPSLPNVRLYGLSLRPNLPSAGLVNGARLIVPHATAPELPWPEVARHGVAEYDRPLPDHIIAHFDLVPLHASREDAANAVVNLAVAHGLLRYAQQYEDIGRGGEYAATNAIETLAGATRIGYLPTGQYRADDIAEQLRAVMLARGLFVAKA